MSIPSKHDGEESNRRRDRHDIVAEILKNAKSGKIKTHIMYKAKLSYYQVQEYLPLLIERGWLETTTIKRRRNITTLYNTTKKGMAVLNQLEFIDKLWNYQ